MTIMRAVGIALSGALGIGLVAAIVWGSQTRPETITVPAGTTFVVALDQDLATAARQSDDEVRAHTLRPVQLAGGMEIPAGSLITGEIVADGNDDEGAEPTSFAIRFTDLVLEGDSTEIEIQTELFRFGTLTTAVTHAPIEVPVTRPFAIRLTRPVTLVYRQPPEPIHAAE